jgi:hypothetical protein
MKASWLCAAALWLPGCTTLERAVQINSGTGTAQVMLYPGANHRLEASGRSYRDDYFGLLARTIAVAASP